MDSFPLKFVILTVSDSCFAKTAEDLSGPALQEFVLNNKGFKGIVLHREVVPDDKLVIKETLIKFCENLAPDVILTTGGTGFGRRDITPEATREVIEKEAPGLSIAMLLESLKITPMAMLSRLICGIRKHTLIINLPGSKKGCTECLAIIAPTLSHAVHLLRDEKANIKMVHHNIHQCHHHFEDVIEVNENISLNQPLARRARKSVYPAISVDEALKIVLDNAEVLGTEIVPYLNSCGRILAEDIIAKDSLPPFPASIKDGYAVIAEDGSGARDVLGGCHAGLPFESTKVLPGQCVRINTGAPIPDGANAVVQVEDTKLISETDEGMTELKIEILASPKPGQDIRPIGSDIAKGQTVLFAGIQLGYTELGILSTVGVTQVKVYQLPVIGILSTGNELVHPSIEKLEPGKIRDSNKTVITFLFHQLGFPVIDLGIATDNEESIIKIFQDGIEKCDVIISTGGVSMGDKDLLKPVLQTHFNAKLHFGRVFVKPGLPTTFLTIDSTRTLFFALPGNPVSAAVMCNLFAVPAIRKMSGFLKVRQTIIKVRIGHSITLDPRPEYQRAVLQWTETDNIPIARVTDNQISSKLLSLVKAQGLIILPPASKDKLRVEGGEMIDCMIIGPI